MSKNIEVEIKVKANKPVKEIENQLNKTAEYIKSYRQRDLYFNHPSRDFSDTDEALRIREVGNQHYLTYKGGKIDKVSKSREEIETKINETEKHEKILKRLGFKPVEKVEKTRKKYQIEDYQILIDKVDDLGTFIEIETTSSPKEYKKALKGAKKHIKQLGFEEKDFIRKSYLEMKLEKTK
ncbi:class IV adenylate cyclase [Methanonatronarchaeum sp. AMET-Sl]|uniref:class IV adenylate cyclase n=1 Tax=Methanonatronarchaeum sp. AMET-Sl TaxID=3037654 RepID=UPI00244E0302|nr:class IV adenylate cyclase [Methanonatronarchaeum sp. AMET-Sl]WGI17291.1 class IV adenylate cyclase [Methanonatronarchaeum sp. AMET-Sl]